MEKRREPNNPFGGPQVIKKSDLRPRKSPRFKLAGLAAGGAALLYLVGRLTTASPPSPPKAPPAHAPPAEPQAAAQEPSPVPPGRTAAEATSLSLINSGDLLAHGDEAAPAAKEPLVQTLPPASEVARPDAGAVRALEDGPPAQQVRLKAVSGLPKVGRDFEATREGFPNVFRNTKVVLDSDRQANDAAPR